MENALQQAGQWRSLSALILLALLFAWESLRPFFAFFGREPRERIHHGLKNVTLGISNSLLTGLLFVGLWWTTAGWAEAHQFGLLNWLSLPTWGRLILVFLLFDAWMYWWHRLNHRVPLLWRFHRTHHSDPKMDVTSASRFHFGEIAISSLLRVPVIALLGLKLWELALYELAMFSVVQFHHANIAVPAWLDRALRVVIVTPFMHKVHHSRRQPETDSNYSSLFSWWDRLFRSYRIKENPQTLKLGLDEFSRPEDQTLAGLLATPLKRAKKTGMEDPANMTTHP